MISQLNFVQAWLRTRRDSERGATAVEYGLLIVFIGLVMAVGAFTLGGALNDLFDAIGGYFDGAPVPNAP